MGHELNSALTVLTLGVQMLRRGAPSDEKFGERLAEIAAQNDEVRRASARLLARMEYDVHAESVPAQITDPSIADPVAKPHDTVVNNNTTFLHLMDELLGQEEGYRVSTSFVGGEAHSFVREVQPDLVVLDLVFGKSAEQGWRTLDLLTLDPATRSIPVIVCSAATVQLHQHADWLRRFDIEVLTKPFDLDVLLEMVATTLGEPRTGTARSDQVGALVKGGRAINLALLQRIAAGDPMRSRLFTDMAARPLMGAGRSNLRDVECAVPTIKIKDPRYRRCFHCLVASRDTPRGTLPPRLPTAPGGGLQSPGAQGLNREGG